MSLNCWADPILQARLCVVFWGWSNKLETYMSDIPSSFVELSAAVLILYKGRCS
jgi:hypothetical protein